MGSSEDRNSSEPFWAVRELPRCETWGRTREQSALFSNPKSWHRGGSRERFPMVGKRGVSMTNYRGPGVFALLKT